MAEIDILRENEIEIYDKPDHKVKMRVITYQVEGMAPRTVWVDRSKLPELAYQDKNPGKPIPADVLKQGDVVRRQAIEADIAKLQQAPKPRRI